MKKIEDRDIRHLKDVSYDELQRAMVELCKKLRIAGSYYGVLFGHYNLYSVVRLEKAKVSPEDPFTKSILEEYDQKE